LKVTLQAHLSLYVTNSSSSSGNVPSKLAGPENLAAGGPWKLSQASQVAHETMPMHDLPEVQSGRPVLADMVRNGVVGLKRNDHAIVGVTKAVIMCNGVKMGCWWIYIANSLAGRIIKSMWPGLIWD
jgi:hypothetical protein